MSNPPAGMKYVTTATNSNAPHALTATNSVRQSQKQSKVQNMKTQQFLLLQQKYQQASSQAQGQTGL